MDGIICINKPEGFTSFDVVAVARRIFQTKKIGHGGTLDPMATGVLPLFLGAATKAVDYCPNTDKEYIAGFKFGITTDTQDITGTVLDESGTYVSRNKIALIERIKGEIEQVPPMYSAVKIKGVRLYDLARKGEEVERSARRVKIYDIKVLDYRDNCGILKVKCSSGTYIRTLIHDFGQQLGAGAVMTSLQRTMSSGFIIDNCVTLDELEGVKLNKGNEGLQEALLPLGRFYDIYPKATLTPAQTVKFSNGVVLEANNIKFDRIYEGLYAVYDCNGNFGALAKIARDHTLEIIQRFRPTDVKLAKGIRKKVDE